MFSERGWISTDELANAAGISRQAACNILREGLRGRCWRGRALQVRRIYGAGGRGGVAYQVALASLPPALRLGRQARPDREPAAPRLTAAPSPDLVQRIDLIAPALETEPGSPARGQAVHLAARSAGVSRRTVYRWIRQYQAHGVRGLERARPCNAGARRVWVSRVFDRAWRRQGHSEEQLQAIAAELAKTLKGLWASRAEQAGAAEIRRLAEYLLLEICEGRRVHVPRDAFRLSRRAIERFSRYRVINQRRNDRKAFDDARPRIRRDWTGLAPMERVIADVKHLDVIVSRDDGTPAWPKIVAFMDAGTGRVFVHPVLLERGEGVRQEHVIEAFIAMVADPAWGFPQGLYLDNGSEFGALAKIDHALQLLNAPGARTLIYARPYNAAAKPIESLFARLDRQVFALLPGYAGPNRMAQKTQTVGKPPTPFPGRWEAFCALLRELILAHNLRPVGGLWGNRSPQTWFEQKQAEGWKPATIELCSLDAAFADLDSRRVDRGILKIGGQRYTHPAITALPSRTVVDLALPWRRGAAPLAKIAGRWLYLETEIAYPARWIEGGRESDRRRRAQQRHVSDLAKEAPRVDPVAAKIRWARHIEAAGVRQPTCALELGDELRQRGGANPPEPANPKDLRRAREMALTERLEREQRRDG